MWADISDDGSDFISSLPSSLIYLISSLPSSLISARCVRQHQYVRKGNRNPPNILTIPFFQIKSPFLTMIPIAPRPTPYVHPSQRYLQSSTPTVVAASPMRQPTPPSHALDFISSPSPLGTCIVLPQSLSPTKHPYTYYLRSSPPMVGTGSPMRLPPQTHALGFTTSPSPPETGMLPPLLQSPPPCWRTHNLINCQSRISPRPSPRTQPTLLEQMFTSPMQ